MKARLYLLTLSVALGVAAAQDTPQNSPAKPQPNTQSGATKDAANGSSGTALPEMKTTTFKGVLVDMACASRSASDSGASCPVSGTSSELGMKLDDGKTVRFDLVGNQRAQDALKNDKRLSKDMSANKPLHVKVSGVMNGDKLIVASIQ